MELQVSGHAAQHRGSVDGQCALTDLADLLAALDDLLILEGPSGLAKGVAAACGARSCAIWLCDPQRTHAILAGRHESRAVHTRQLRPHVDLNHSEALAALLGGCTPLGPASRQGRAICRVLGTPTGMVAPLRTAGGAVGVLHITLPAGASSRALMPRLRLVAAHAALCIDRNSLAEQAAANAVHGAAQAVRLALVQQTARALAASTSVQTLCDTLVQTLHAAMGHHIASVLLRTGDTLEIVAHRVPAGIPS